MAGILACQLASTSADNTNDAVMVTICNRHDSQCSGVSCITMKHMLMAICLWIESRCYLPTAWEGWMLVTDTTLYQRLLDGQPNNASWSLGGDINMANVN